ncbi:ATP-binding protein [Agromyces bauzanensis]
MDSEIIWRTGNLMLTDSGTWWAVWRLTPLSYSNDARKEDVRRAHQELFQAIRGEALLLGFTAEHDPGAIVERMMRGVRMDHCPDYLDEVELTLESLESVRVGTRAFWLAVPLATTSWQAKAQSVFTASWGKVQSTLGLPRRTPSPLEIRSARESALVVERALPGALTPLPATPAELAWIHFHSQLRGLRMDEVVPTPDVDADPEVEFTVMRSGRELSYPLLDEGGQSDVKRRERFVPFRRRYLKVESDRADVASYQAMLAVTGTPPGGWTFPGVEWISWVDQMGIDVDWAIRMQVVDAEQSKDRNRRAERTLDDQYEQQSGNVSITGSQNGLDHHAALLQEFHGKISADEREVEVQATIVFAIGGDSAEEVSETANTIRKQYRAQNFILDAVLGEQESLWWAMQPGVPTTRIVRELAQLSTGRDLSTTVPVITYDVGDEHGILVGENISSGRNSPTFLDLYGATQSNLSGSCAVVGELGGGKSVNLKIIAGAVVDRGGRLVVIDRSQPLEYAKFARTLAPESTTIVEILNPEYSLDPLRVFGNGEGPRITQSLFAAMLRVEAFDERGTFLSSVLDPEYTAANGIDSLQKLLQHVSELGTPEAQSLARTMNTIASKPDLGRVLFDSSLPPLPLKARATVFCTRGLELPKEAELANEQRYRHMSIEKIFGAAIYSLLASIGRTICFATDEEFALFLVDEAHHMTSQPTGLEEITRFVTEGRKSAAAIALGTQTVAQLGSADVRGLIPIRIVMRLQDENLARDAAKWLAGEKASDELVEDIQSLSPPDPRDPNRRVPLHRRGESIMRDSQKRLGHVRWLLPQREARREAILTTPPTLDLEEVAA